MPPPVSIHTDTRRRRSILRIGKIRGRRVGPSSSASFLYWPRCLLYQVIFSALLPAPSLLLSLSLAPPGG